MRTLLTNGEKQTIIDKTMEIIINQNQSDGCLVQAANLFVFDICFRIFGCLFFKK